MGLVVVLMALVMRRVGAGAGWRGAFLAAAVAWGILIALGTELMSLWNGLTPVAVGIYWVLIFLIALAMAFRVDRNSTRVFAFHMPDWPKSDILLLAGTVFIVATVGLIAIVAPPNNVDSLIYHMSRVMHWIQNRNVFHYPTHITRQLFSPPWAEFAILHLQLLSGGDRFANLVQWFAMAGSIIGVSLIAKIWGMKRRGQILSGVIAATIPMGILQGSSTQNDFVASFWLVCMVVFILLSLKEPHRPFYWAGIGGSLGLALLTKPTPLIYALPFLIWFIISGFQRLQWRVVKPLAFVVSIVFILNVGHSLRNADFYKHHFEQQELDEIVDVLDYRGVISNVILNTCLHLGTPWEAINSQLEAAVRLAHQHLGWKIQDPRTSDPRATLPGLRFGIPKPSTHEDRAGNLIHVLLLLVCLLIYFGSGTRKTRATLNTYCLCLVTAYFVYCALVIWNPWSSRLHLPLFVLWSPWMACVLSGLRWKWVTSVLGALLIVLALPWVFHNRTRDLLGMHHSISKKLVPYFVDYGPYIGGGSILVEDRLSQYFNFHHDHSPYYFKSVEYLHSLDCYEIGLDIPSESLEYLFWVLLEEKGDAPFRLEHVNVRNISKVKLNEARFKTFNPCAIMSLARDRGKAIMFADSMYVKQLHWKKGGIYVRSEVTKDKSAL